MKNFLYRNKILIDSPFPWWEWDVLNNTVDFNDKKALMLGYEPEMFSSGGYQAFTDLLHPDDYEKTMNAMRQLLEGEKKPVSDRLQNPGGRQQLSLVHGQGCCFRKK